MGLFKTYYNDNTAFIGGVRLNKTKWNEIDKPITKLRANVGCKHITLVGYDSYNHIVEWAQGVLSDINKATLQILMGNRGTKVERYIYNLTNGDFSYDVVNYGEEYNGGAVTGWKEGVTGTPTVSIGDKCEPFIHSPLD